MLADSSVPQKRITATVPAVEAVGQRRVRRWPRRLAIGAIVMAIMGVLAVDLGYVYLEYRFRQIPRTACPDCFPGSGPMTVLLIGSDTRAGITPAEARAFCLRPDCSDKIGPEHTDTIMLLHFDPKQKKSTLLSIPRDLNVAIAGTNRRDRINTAYAKGPGPLIRTIHDALGIDVNHFAIVEVWQSKQAYEAHLAHPHTKAFRDQLQGGLGSPFDERLYNALP